MRLKLKPSLDPADYPFTHTLRTRFAETDAMGIIHHGAYLAYLEEARVEYLRQRGRPYHEVRSDGVDLAVLEAYLQYRRPLRFDDPVDIGVVVGERTRTTVQIAYLLTVAGEVRATAVTVHGAVGPDGRATRLPDFIARRPEHPPA